MGRGKPTHWGPGKPTQWGPGQSLGHSTVFVFFKCSRLLFLLHFRIIFTRGLARKWGIISPDIQVKDQSAPALMLVQCALSPFGWKFLSNIIAFLTAYQSSSDIFRALQTFPRQSLSRTICINNFEYFGMFV